MREITGYIFHCFLVGFFDKNPALFDFFSLKKITPLGCWYGSALQSHLMIRWN